MNIKLIYAAILSILPISELRGGLIYASLNGLNPLASFLICTIANILVIFLIFFFLDKINHLLLGIKFYKRFFDKYLEILHKKIDKFEERYSAVDFLALVFLTAIPIPIIGGAWTAVLISWILDLDRKKSILAIALGVVIAAILVFAGTFGLASLLH
jgi:uncharacterized membrane protein